ncbi:MAG TPA: hypothetical protein VD886_09655, partial [Herpetosiphonaceae bacterium]|nr:hypothetical protein [Herpetosiphonaceae bacterium]
IPSGAATGSGDAATIRVQAAVAPAIGDSATLTTVAVGAGVGLSPASQSRSGAGGAEVRYQFTVTNRTGSSRAFNLALAGNQWPGQLRDDLDQPISATPVLAPDASAAIGVVVTLPADVLVGKRDRATLTASASDNPAIAAQSAITTTAAIGWERRDDLPAAVGEATLISDGSRLHLLGGVGEFFAASSAHRVYDPTTAAWGAGPALPAPLYSADGCAIGGKLYLPGGRSSVSAYAGTFHVFDVAANSWGTLPSVTTVSAGKQPIRYKAVCDPGFGAQGAVYLIGGADRAADLAALNTAYRFDIGANGWQTLPPLSTRRANPFGGLIDGAIFIAGGQSTVAYASALGSAEAYDPAADAWSARPAMPVATTAGGSAVVAGELYAFGGRKAAEDTTVATADAYRFNPAAGTWTAIPALTTERLLIGAAAQAGIIYAAGGNVTGDKTFETFAVGGGTLLAVSAGVDAPALVDRGETFATTITVTATGTVGAPLAGLTATLPLASDYAGGLSASSGAAAYDAASRSIRWSGALVVSAPLVITYASTVRADAPLGAVFATAATVSDGEDRADSLVVASASTRVNGPELIYSCQQVAPGSAGFSDTVTYTLRMVNSGSAAATASLVDQLPAGLTFGAFVNDDGGAATYDAANRRVLWNGALPPTSQLDYTLRPTAYAWTEISSIGSAVGAGQWIANDSYPADDEGYAAIALPWPVPFYGETFATLYIDSNGQVGFSPFSASTSPFGGGVDTAIPAPGYPNHRVALRYSDLDLAALAPGGGQVYTYHDQAADRFIVQFKAIKGYTGADAGTSQLIIEPDGRMVLQYQQVGAFIFAGEIGIENRAGTAGLFLETVPANGSAFEVLPPFFGQPAVVFTATVNAAAPTSGSLVNLARLSDGLGTTRELSAALTLIGADVSLRKSASAPVVPVGGLVTYTLEARNGAAYPGLARLSDALPAGLEYVAGSLSGGQYFPVTNTVQWSGQLGVADYSLSSATSAAAFTDISASGTPTGLGDEDGELLELPFPFIYYGEAYTRTALVANGYLRMI